MRRALSSRHLALVDAALGGQTLWDIGCDHGLVGLTALREGRCSDVVLIDRSTAVIEALRQKIERHLLPDEIERTRVLCADARFLGPQVVTGTVVIAGLGARLMIQILENFVVPNAVKPCRWLLHPEVERERLRFWLSTRHEVHLRDDVIVDQPPASACFVVDLR